MELNTYKNTKHDDDKSIVLVSSGFLKTYDTTTNNKLFGILKKDYHVYGIDNVGHGGEKNSKFTIANQQELLLSLIKSIDTSIHLIGNSFPGIYTIYALENLLSDKDTKGLIEDKLKSITLISPATNSLGALDDYFAKCNFFVRKFYQSPRGRKKILNFLLKNRKSVNGDIDDLYNRSEDSMRFINNIKKILNVSNTIPTHVVFNTGDKAVLQQDKDSDQAILEIMEKKSSGNLGYTYTTENRHAVYLQDGFNESSVINKNESTVGDSVKKFIDNNN